MTATIDIQAPSRTLDQRQSALRRANEIRSLRAEFKRDLKARRVQVWGVIDSPPDWLESAKIFDLLLAVPKLGRVKVNRILLALRISPSKTVGGLTDRQRDELLERLAPDRANDQRSRGRGVVA